LLYKGKSGFVPSIIVQPIDTTGAGDAFYAGVLTKLDCVQKEMWTQTLFDKVFRFANVCGALTTLGKGAIDALPTLDKIDKLLIKLKRKLLRKCFVSSSSYCE